MMLKTTIFLMMSLVVMREKDIVTLLQQRYDKIKDFKSDFIQSYYSANGTMLMESSGTLYYKKSSMFKWIYKTPKKKEFVVKGNKLFIYLKDDAIVYIDEDFRSSQMNMVLLFLYGEGSIENQFNIDKVEEEGVYYRLFLTPKEKDSTVARLIISAERSNINVEKLEITDNLGNRNVFRFKNTHFDTGVKESFFIFKIPENVEISPLPKDMFR